MAEKRRVLVVEDDPVAFATVHDFLSDAGYEVVSAASSKQVRWCFAEQRPAVVLLNAHLASESGVGVLVGIRQHPEGADLPVIAIVYENVAIDFQRQLEQYRVSDFVTRPLDQRRLLACVGAHTGAPVEPVRREHRYRAASTVHVQLPDALEYEAYQVRDVSREGLFLQTNDPPPPLTRIRVRIHPYDGGDDVDLDGRVAHVVTAEAAAARGTEPGMGVRLMALSEPQRAAFDAFCDGARSEGARGDKASATGAGSDRAALAQAPVSERPGAPGRRVQAVQVRASRDELQMTTVLRNQLLWLRDSDDYQALGVEPGADRLTVERAFLALRKEYHPDRYAHYKHPKIAELAHGIYARLREAEERLLAIAPEQPVDLELRDRTSTPPLTDSQRLSWQQRDVPSLNRPSRPAAAGGGMPWPQRRPSAAGRARVSSAPPLDDAEPPSSERGRSSAPPSSQRSGSAAPLSSPGSTSPPTPPATQRSAALPPPPPSGRGAIAAGPSSRHGAALPPPPFSERGPVAAAAPAPPGPFTPPPPTGYGGPPAAHGRHGTLPGMSAPSPASAPAAPEAATGHEGQAESYHARGLAALDQGRLQDAKNLLQHAAKISRAPEHEAAFALTRALLAEQQQQYEEALELLKVAAKLDRSERVAAAYRRIGELAKGKGRLFRR